MDSFFKFRVQTCSRRDGSLEPCDADEGSSVRPRLRHVKRRHRIFTSDGRRGLRSRAKGSHLLLERHEPVRDRLPLHRTRRSLSLHRRGDDILRIGPLSLLLLVRVALARASLEGVELALELRDARVRLGLGGACARSLAALAFHELLQHGLVRRCRDARGFGVNVGAMRRRERDAPVEPRGRRELLHQRRRGLEEQLLLLVVLLHGE